MAAATATPIPTLEEYDRMAAEYKKTLTLEDIMESGLQARQRSITLVSFEAIKVRWPEVQICNELLVQYPLPGGKTGWIVPDNMVVVQAESLESKKSFNILREKSPVLLAMEYVSEDGDEKDYEVNFKKYRDGVKAAYHLLFDPVKQVLNVHRLVDGEYVKLEPDLRGRVAIPELEVETAIVDRWTRFWFRGELMRDTAEMVFELDAARLHSENLEQERDHIAEERDHIAEERDLERAAKEAAQVEIRKAEEAKQLAEAERRRIELEKQKAERDLDEERKNRAALAEELEKLRAELARRQP